MELNLKTIKIVEWGDTHECETCGTDYASGGDVYYDNERVLHAPPRAHCYSGASYSSLELLVMALKQIGIRVVDGDDQVWHVDCLHGEYHEY